MSFGIKRNPWNQNGFAFLLPFKIVVSMTLFIIFFTASLVLLQRRSWLIFCKIFITYPILIANGGKLIIRTILANKEFRWIFDNIELISDWINQFVWHEFVRYLILNLKINFIGVNIFCNKNKSFTRPNMVFVILSNVHFPDNAPGTM